MATTNVRPMNSGGAAKQVHPADITPGMAIGRAILPHTVPDSPGAVEEMLDRFDSNNDGTFDREEVRAMCLLMIKEEKKVQDLKRILIFAVIATIAIAIGVFALCVGANEATKNTHISGETESAALMVGNDGQPLATESVDTPIALLDLLEMPSDILDKLDKLSFTTPANALDTECALDDPETEYTVDVTGYLRTRDDEGNSLNMQIVTGFTNTASGEPLVINMNEQRTMFLTEGKNGNQSPICPDDGESALATDSSGRRRLKTELFREQPAAMEVDANGDVHDTRRQLSSTKPVTKPRRSRRSKARVGASPTRVDRMYSKNGRKTRTRARIRSPRNSTEE